MKQIYSFEQFSPPPLSEAELVLMAARRRRQRELLAAAVAAALWQICLMLSFWLLFLFAPQLALYLLAADLLSLAAAVTAGIIFLQKRRRLLWQ